MTIEMPSLRHERQLLFRMVKNTKFACFVTSENNITKQYRALDKSIKNNIIRALYYVCPSYLFEERCDRGQSFVNIFQRTFIIKNQNRIGARYRSY